MSNLNLGDTNIFNNNYSKTEVKTGATWIDGKPVYRKVVEFTTPTTAGAGTNFYPHGISGLKRLVDLRVMTIGSDTVQRILNFSYYGSPDSWSASIYVNSANIAYEHGVNWTNYHLGQVFYAILEYTKTTD